MSCKELCPVLGEDGTEQHIVSVSFKCSYTFTRRYIYNMKHCKFYTDMLYTYGSFVCPSSCVATNIPEALQG